MSNRIFPLALAILAVTARAWGNPAPAPTEVLATMERVADWQLAHIKPDDKGGGKPTGWVNAVFYAGVMALARDSASPRFHDAMMKMAEENKWQPAARVYHADDHAVCQTYLDLYLQHHDPRMLAPTQERFDYILAHPKDNNLDFDRTKNPDRLDRWSWCDALFMAPPAWARLWQATGNKAYLDFAVTKWWVTSDYLYDQEEHLYFRDSSLFAPREKNGRKIFWSRGNGWVMAGLVRMLELLPPDHPSRPRFEQQFRELAVKVVACQQADGFWRSSLLDPASYAMQETSGTGFYCHALAWGVNTGLLERARFEPAVLRAWTALISCVKADGKLTHVQPVGFTPVTFDPESTEPFGVGAFLLAGSEVRRLGASPHQSP
jgi:unsaturated rhamnogalacturonyl hydrolase